MKKMEKQERVSWKFSGWARFSSNLSTTKDKFYHQVDSHVTNVYPAAHTKKYIFWKKVLKPNLRLAVSRSLRVGHWGWRRRWRTKQSFYCPYNLCKNVHEHWRLPLTCRFKDQSYIQTLFQKYNKRIIGFFLQFKFRCWWMIFYMCMRTKIEKVFIKYLYILHIKHIMGMAKRIFFLFLFGPTFEILSQTKN